MKCPVCHSLDQNEMDLQSDQFKEDIIECRHCGAVWAINHDLLEMVNDPQEASFLGAITETVEGDDYCYEVA